MKQLCIPRIIFQTWKTHSVPEKWKTSPESIKTFMPSWKHVLFDDSENEAFVKIHFPEYIDFYKKLKFPIQRADFIRYCFLYINGGVYADLDIEFIAPIDDLFVMKNSTKSKSSQKVGQDEEAEAKEEEEEEAEKEAKVYLLKAPQNFAGHYTNFFMASTARNPFWLIVLRECVEKLPPWVILPHNIISEQTGLACISRAVRKAQTENQTSIEILPFQNLVPCDVCSTPSEYERRPYFYTKFLKGGRWNGLDTHIFNTILCNRIEIMFFIGFVIACVVLRFFLRKRQNAFIL